ncbi:mannosyltransferase putative-domain-containing protein [Radiomyces spectabilis]|uniref:mannosyltransferase putative-domain-containing protein n=1 Tax=Radiomyces spectabilis TaxID=64574 RepID=UPI00221E8C70|nr:mannosyltransferase putative-domain-containing protein [Radiomyces spectabilis]KAI8388803.1 mannosyltransferase putative-domain-containing protein [Radiomyces spectabilis]
MEFKLLLTAEVPDFSILTYQQRVFKGLYQYFDPILAEGKIDVAHDPKYSKAWALYEKLEHIVYPWIRPHWPNMFHANNGTAGRGIVLCVGNHQFQHAATTIRGIREVLKSELPIEVFYIRDDDLSEGRRRYLETEFDNLKIVKAVDYINDFYTQFGGWAVKPYAILASSFSEVIMMDADAFFFQKPETLFDDEGYKATGTLFFYDRTLFANWDVGKRWLQSFLPTKSSLVEKTRWWQLRSAHEQESGVVVVNKKKSLLGLLATCKMNDKHERDEVTYKKMHGDKETFWIGYEMMQTPYAFVKSYGAVIGGLGDAGDKNNVCGNQLHLDAQGKPWWWNGGLLRDKHRWADRYLIFTHYAEGEDWHFETSCIKETDKIHAFTETDKGIATRYIALDQQRRKDEALIEQGTWEPSTH